MRVTGGQIRGRILKVPKAEMRPTQDMVREALFSMLAQVVPGSRFLDLYAGTGSVGIEAWSRGAEAVCMVESGRKVLPVLTENVKALCGEGARVIACDVMGFLKKRLVDSQFDIIFCDPPYEKGGEHGVLKEVLAKLAENGLLAPGGVFVMEQHVREPIGLSEGWELRDERTYGQTRLRFLVQKR